MQIALEREFIRITAQVNDGSNEMSKEMLDILESRLDRVKVVHHPQNKGYGGALRSGFSACSKDWVFYPDGHAQYDSRQLKLLFVTLRDDVDVLADTRSRGQTPSTAPSSENLSSPPARGPDFSTVTPRNSIEFWD